MDIIRPWESQLKVIRDSSPNTLHTSIIKLESITGEINLDQRQLEATLWKNKVFIISPSWSHLILDFWRQHLSSTILKDAAQWTSHFFLSLNEFKYFSLPRMGLINRESNSFSYSLILLHDMAYLFLYHLLTQNFITIILSHTLPLETLISIQVFFTKLCNYVFWHQILKNLKGRCPKCKSPVLTIMGIWLDNT